MDLVIRGGTLVDGAVADIGVAANRHESDMRIAKQDIHAGAGLA